MKNKTSIFLVGVIILLGGFILLTKKDVLIKREVVDEESAVMLVVEKSTESVVTISTGDKDVGTGFIIDSDGLIVTNKHVVVDVNSKYRVILGKNVIVDVSNVYRDPVTDLAIIKVDRTGLSSVKLGDSSKIKVGQTVIAIGTALGQFRSTVTRGVVSGLGRGITAGNSTEATERLDDVIQTDAAINPGNSGGPLFNLSGEVIGVNVAVNQGAQSIGFALPINLVKESIDNFKITGQFDRPYLGVGYRVVDNPAGDLVEQVAVNSPAQKAGIVIGDVITEVDGKNLVNEKNTVLSTYINRKRIEESVKVKLIRAGQEINLTVILEKKQ